MRTALGFLTRLPVRATHPDLNRAALYFPLVGLLVGALAAATRIAADQVLPPLPSTLLALAVAMIATGALHEDGLADVADAIGAHTSNQRRLEILKDPRVGTFGALALIFAVTLTATALATLNTDEAARALIAAHILARGAIVPMSRLPPAKPGGAGALLHPGTPTIVASTLIAIALALATAPPIALAGAAIATIATALILKRTLGGITGDGYGATAKLTELAVVLTLCAWWT